jgi:hypothetical protein
VAVMAVEMAVRMAVLIVLTTRSCPPDIS